MTIILMFTCMVIDANEVKVIDKVNNNDITRIFNKKVIEKNYDFFVDNEQLGKLIGLSKNDTVKMNNVYRTYCMFCDSMKVAESVNDNDERIGHIFSSLDYVLKNMRLYLNDVQYHMFLQCLNLSMMNHGFEEESFKYVR